MFASIPLGDGVMERRGLRRDHSSKNPLRGVGVADKIWLPTRHVAMRNSTKADKVRVHIFVRERKRTTVFAVFVVVASATATLYFAFTDSGPYRWLEEAQLRWFAAHVPEVTAAATLLAIAAPPLLASYIATRFVGERIDAVDEQAVADSFMRASHRLELLLVVGGFIFGGAYLYWSGERDSPLTRVSAGQLESSRPPASDYLEIEGIPLGDVAIRLDTDPDHRTYVPLVSTRSREPHRAAVFLDLSSADFAQLASGEITSPYRGVAKRHLPGAIRDHFERQNVTPPDPLVLSYGKVPGHREDGPILTLIGATTGAVWFLFRRWELRRARGRQGPGA
jgi:hypothetical protein